MSIRILAFVLVVLLIAMGYSQDARSGSMEATWYGPGFEGQKTASGETFNSQALTAAQCWPGAQSSS